MAEPIEERGKFVNVRIIVQIVSEGLETGAESLNYCAPIEGLDAVVWRSGPVDFVTKGAIKSFKKANGWKDAK